MNLKRYLYKNGNKPERSDKAEEALRTVVSGFLDRASLTIPEFTQKAKKSPVVSKSWYNRRDHLNILFNYTKDVRKAI